jgi:predicted metal-dependent RNase
MTKEYFIPESTYNKEPEIEKPKDEEQAERDRAMEEFLAKGGKVYKAEMHESGRKPEIMSKRMKERLKSMGGKNKK